MSVADFRGAMKEPPFRVVLGSNLDAEQPGTMVVYVAFILPLAEAVSARRLSRQSARPCPQSRN